MCFHDERGNGMRKGFKVAARMPELSHWSGKGEGEPFDIERSEAARWLCSQPEIMTAVFDICKGNRLIAYDGESGTWHGTDRDGIE